MSKSFYANPPRGKALAKRFLLGVGVGDGGGGGQCPSSLRPYTLFVLWSRLPGYVEGGGGSFSYLASTTGEHFASP